MKERSARSAADVSTNVVVHGRIERLSIPIYESEEYLRRGCIGHSLRVWQPFVGMHKVTAAKRSVRAHAWR